MRNCAWLALVLLAACGGEEEAAPSRPPPPPPPPKEEPGGPPRILVDRILITFEGNAQGLASHRPRERAKELAYDLLERLRAVDRKELLHTFALLKEEYSDDPAKTAKVPYVLCNYGIPPRPRRDGLPEVDRGNMFGQLPWRLEPGEFDVLDYDGKTAPAGWDIVLRLR